MSALSTPAGVALTPEALPQGRRLDRRRYQWSSSVLLAPAIVLVGLVFIYGVGYSIYLGFTNLSLTGANAVHYSWTGTENLKRLGHDSVFWHSLWITFVFVFGSGVVGATAIGLALAVLMEKALAGLRLLAGAIVLIAFMLPPVTIAVVWYAASINGGTFATLAGNPGADPLFKAPLLFVSLANMWSLVGLSMLLFSAALRNIPGDIVEAAVLEGAGGLKRFWTITLPMLRQTILTSALLMTLLSLGNFTIVWLMTQGGPGNATNILPVYSYQQGFVFSNLGYGALLGNVMVILSAIFGVGYVRAERGRRKATTR